MNSPSPLNYLDVDKLKAIPVGLRARHEFCFYVHDQMLHLLKEADASHIRSMQLDLTPEERDALSRSPHDPIGVLLQTSKRPEARRLLLNHVMLALTADMLNFIYEGLTALGKRKYVVGFATLRKPFRETLFYLSLLLADEDEFFRLFENGPSDGMKLREFRPAQREGIFQAALTTMLVDEVFDAKHLNRIAFDKSDPDGLAGLFDKAQHLVTSFNLNLRTEPLNFNFVFKDSRDADVFQASYPHIAYVLMYLFGVVTSLFSRALPIDKDHVGKLVLIMFAVYHSLFCRGRSPIVATVNRAFKDIMKCTVCDAEFTIDKAGAPRFFIAERMVCKRCGADTDFPILWLMAKAGITLSKDDPHPAQ